MTNLVVWKYDLSLKGKTVLMIPQGGKVLTLQLQDGMPKIWVLINPNNSTEVRKFQTIFTGNESIDEDEIKQYIGTYQGSGLVFHTFELIVPVPTT